MTPFCSDALVSPPNLYPPWFHHTLPHCSAVRHCSTVLFHSFTVLFHCSLLHTSTLLPYCSTLFLRTGPQYCSTMFHTVPMFHHIVSHCSTVLPHCSTVPPHCSTLFHTIIPYYFLPWCFSASASCDIELCYEPITLVLRDYSMRTNFLELPNGCFQMSVLSCLLN